MQRNAKDELIEHLHNKPQIRCIKIETPRREEQQTYLLKENFTPRELDNLLKSLDFKYDCGYGCQALFGAIWYVDDTYSDRVSLNNTELWVYLKAPQIPPELRN